MSIPKDKPRDAAALYAKNYSTHLDPILGPLPEPFLPLGLIVDLLGKIPDHPFVPQKIQRQESAPILAQLDRAPADFGAWLADQIERSRARLTVPPNANDEAIFRVQHRMFEVMRSAIGQAQAVFHDDKDKYTAAMEAIGPQILALLADPQISGMWKRWDLETKDFGVLRHLTKEQRAIWMSDVAHSPAKAHVLEWSTGISETHILPPAGGSSRERSINFGVLAGLVGGKREKL